MTSFMNNTFTTYCGLDCDNCSFKISHNCGGCRATNGQPFYGSCKVADCAIKRNKRFCGECENFPCEILKEYSYDPIHGDNGERIENCRLIKARMVTQARSGINPIGFCGLHCNHCFGDQFGFWCGGCRSEYPCCSFATLFENGICPNLACAKAKGFSGCYQCSDLPDCSIGFYGSDHKYVAKASALFIAKYGEAAFTDVLDKAALKGIEYPKDLNELGIIESALKLLEDLL